MNLDIEDRATSHFQQPVRKVVQKIIWLTVCTTVVLAAAGLQTVETFRGTVY